MRGLWADADPVAPWDWRAGKGRGLDVPAVAVIGNKHSGLYHAASCRGAAKIEEKNRVMLEGAAKAEAMGYRRAGDCP